MDDLKKSEFIFDNETEWVDVAFDNELNEKIFQNTKCSPLFKIGLKGKPYYLDAICFKELDNSSYCGDAYIDDKDFKRVTSRQYVKFPFVPKTFEIDVVNIEITKEEAEEKNIDTYVDFTGGLYYTKLKNPKQLNKVFKYYERCDHDDINLGSERRLVL